MNEKRINEIVEETYENLITVAQLKIHVMGGYFPLLVEKMKKEEIGIYFDEVVHRLFWKFCSTLDRKIKGEKKEYDFLSMSEVSDAFFEECILLIHNAIQQKKSETTPLYVLLKPMKEKYPNEVEKTLDTLFDILLNNYIAKNNE